MTDFTKLFAEFSRLKIAVVGDVMLDTYWWGNVERISPEAPVPVVSLHHKEQRIGGASNVALNTVSLGASTCIFSVTGQDEDSTALDNLMKEKGIQTNYLVRSSKRITTNKTRIISRNQHMMRLDAEIVKDIDQDEAEQVLHNFKRYVQEQKPAAVIFEDYNKGVLTEELITELIQVCRSASVITAVDPKRKNFFAYKHTDIFKPNLNEVKEGLNLLFDEITEPLLSSIHTRLHTILQHSNSLITLSEKGIFVYQKDNARIIPTHVRNIADVSGAGDTVIAVATLAYAATGNMDLAAEMANLAGGLVCEQVGTVAINYDLLLQECKALLQ